MKYNLNTNHYADFNIYEINKLPARSWFIPFSTREKADSFDNAQKRYHSDKVDCLSGNWDFRFLENPNDLDYEMDSELFLPIRLLCHRAGKPKDMVNQFI